MMSIEAMGTIDKNIQSNFSCKIKVFQNLIHSRASHHHCYVHIKILCKNKINKLPGSPLFIFLNNISCY